MFMACRLTLQSSDLSAYLLFVSQMIDTLLGNKNAVGGALTQSAQRITLFSALQR